MGVDGRQRGIGGRDARSCGATAAVTPYSPSHSAEKPPWTGKYKRTVPSWWLPHTPVNTMQLKTILNHVQKQPGFVYERAELVETAAGVRLHVFVRPNARSRPVCSGCHQKRVGYDHQKERRWLFVPLWNIRTYFIYTPRRCDCPQCGVKIELLPWVEGKNQVTTTMLWFLANWAKVLSWQETAVRFQVGWKTVYGAVENAVIWGRTHMNLDGITAVGVDELSWRVGQKYLTLVYQVDKDCRRLLWIGRDRTAETFGRFFDWLGDERCHRLQFVTSDMWKAFVSTVAKRANEAIHVLDRFHIMKLFGDAVDLVRRDEARRLRAQGDAVTLKHSRWVLLKNKENLTEPQFRRLLELEEANNSTMRGYLLKESFRQFWDYQSAGWAGRFLDHWVSEANETKLEPFMKLGRTLLEHRDLLLNWFRAREAFAAGAVEGFNLKARVTTRIAYGFRSYDHAETALYHRLGNLPEPDWLTHRFW